MQDCHLSYFEMCRYTHSANNDGSPPSGNSNKYDVHSLPALAQTTLCQYKNSLPSVSVIHTVQQEVEDDRFFYCGTAYLLNIGNEKSALICTAFSCDFGTGTTVPALFSNNHLQTTRQPPTSLRYVSRIQTR